MDDFILVRLAGLLTFSFQGINFGFQLFNGTVFPHNIFLRRPQGLDKLIFTIILGG